MLSLLLVTIALSTASLFSAVEPIELTIEAPLANLMTHDRDDDDYRVNGALAVVDGGRSVRVDDVRISLRGHTSRRESECDFPKLKIELPAAAREATPLLAGLHSIKIGTHCGEARDGELTARYGRLANQHSPRREAFVYRLLSALDVPTLSARRAKITYVETGAAEGARRQPLVRDAVLIEDTDDALRRFGAAREIGEREFSDARTKLTAADTVRLAFAEAMIGNFDWCLKMAPDDTYRCDARHPVWNIVAAERADGGVVPLIYDFDVAGMVTGRHRWFQSVFSRRFAPSRSEAEIEVIAQLQRARTLFTRRDLDEARKAFIARKSQAMQALAAANLDPEGETIAKRYLESFYTQIESDEQFYRPVVRSAQIKVYAAADGATVCGNRSVVPVGTPVSRPLQRAGNRVQVMVLDVLWHWTSPEPCDAIRRGPVWIDAGAIGTDFPPSAEIQQ
jgi:hypothetical protein